MRLKIVLLSGVGAPMLPAWAAELVEPHRLWQERRPSSNGVLATPGKLPPFRGRHGNRCGNRVLNAEGEC